MKSVSHLDVYSMRIYTIGFYNFLSIGVRLVER